MRVLDSEDKEPWLPKPVATGGTSTGAMALPKPVALPKPAMLPALLLPALLLPELLLTEPALAAAAASTDEDEQLVIVARFAQVEAGKRDREEKQWEDNKRRRIQRVEAAERSAAAVDPAALLQTPKSEARDGASKETFKVTANRNAKKSESIGKEISKAGLQPVIGVKTAAASNLVAAAATRRTEGSRQTKVP